jgi:hypothetical protein
MNQVDEELAPRARKQMPLHMVLPHQPAPYARLHSRPTVQWARLPHVNLQGVTSTNPTQPA